MRFRKGGGIANKSGQDRRLRSEKIKTTSPQKGETADFYLNQEAGGEGIRNKEKEESAREGVALKSFM